MPLMTGQILNGRYRIVKLLGKGGFGAVYRAWDLNLKCPRAVKENLDTTPQARKQFEKEAQIIANLNHPNLPNVVDHFFVEDQGQYLVMDFVQGEDLQTMLDRQKGPLPEEQVLPWVSQICDALDYLHNQKPPIIHRDIKPANIRITPDGRAMLVDFGIAKVFDPHLSTTIGARAVTPGYSPHEQYGQGRTNPQSDIYALGATLYALLTGREPVESIQRMVRDPLQASEKINPFISPQVAQTIRQAMQMDTNLRLATAKAFKASLKEQPVMVQTLPLPEGIQAGTTVLDPERIFQDELPRTRKISPWIWVSGCAGIIIILLVFVVFYLVLREGPSIGVTATSALGFGQGQQTSNTTTVPMLLTNTPFYTPMATEIIILETDAIPPSWTVVSTMTPMPLPSATPTSFGSEAGETRNNPVDGANMVYVPGGEFQMGLRQDQIAYLQSQGKDCNTVLEHSQPVHAVWVDGFWIYQMEVTNQQYAACVAAGRCNPPVSNKSQKRQSYFGNPDFYTYPVVNISWTSANAYCTWVGGRLPTEAEWEKAARGTDQRLFPWGDSLPNTNLANFNENLGDTERVDAYPQGVSPYGVFNMAGNAYEWVFDWYGGDYYSISPYDNPQGPATGESNRRVVRGGSWGWDLSCLCSASHDWWEYNMAGTGVGFRCVVDG